ncbi:MAG: hypothetical protein WCC22_11990 [Terriglobales bacterium]
MNPFSCPLKCVLRLAVALVAIASLIAAVGCGSSFNSGGGGGQNQGFSNASLNGQYAFTLRGVGTPDGVNAFLFVEGGVFTADGNGNLTAITDDFIENFQAGLNNQATGTYRINKDGSGDLLFKFTNGTQAQYRITLSNDSHFYMEEDEGFNTSSGSGEKQDTTKFASVPSGTFVLQTHDLLAGNSKVGVTTWSAGQISGTGDVLSGGTLFSPVTISGTAQAPSNTTGRGSVTITDDTGTSHYVYYVVNDTTLRFLNIDATSSLGIGRAEAQTGGPFSSASLNGSYVFGSAGETLLVDGIHSIGLFTTDGAGNITAGSFDFVQDGNPVTGISLNPGSTYTVAASGRVDLILNLSTGITNEKVMYLVSPSRALFLVNDPTNVEDGTLDKQSGTFSNSSLNGQAALFMDGFDGVFEDRVGTLTPNGTGALRTNYRSSFFDANTAVGSSKDFAFSGTYTVSGNGRATAQFTGFTDNMLFYLSSTNTGYFLQADQGIDMGGAFTQQTGP